MNSIRILSRSFTVRLTVLISATIVSGILVSAAFFYFYIEYQLEKTYIERLLTLSIYRYAIVKNSLYTYITFTLLTSAAIILFSIYNSHKVAGPLIRIRVFAKQMLEGKFGVKVKFRSGDAIHPVAEAADGFSAKYGVIYGGLRSVTEELDKTANELRATLKSGDVKQSNAAYSQLSSKVENLREILSRIKT